MDKIEIVADFGDVWLIDFLLERLQRFKNPASICRGGIGNTSTSCGQSHCEMGETLKCLVI